MESRSRQRLRRSPPPHGAREPNADDRISALHDDMLLQVLVRLRCARAAARTGLLSRRWRSLWTRLPDLTFRNIPAGVIKSAIARIPRRTAVSLLEIHLVSSAEGKLDDTRAKSLLRSAARLSPEKIVFVLPQSPVIKRGRGVTMALPVFHRATSIELDTQCLRIMSPPAGELPVLEVLSISGNIVNLAAFLNRCPQLRVLRVTFRGVEPGSLEADLATLEAASALGLTVSHLGMEFSTTVRLFSIDGTSFASLLRAATMISPRELLFSSSSPEYFDADMLCFHRTTSIEMNFHAIRFTHMPVGEFAVLERMVLEGCTITDLVTMIIRCPRLRVLKVTIAARDITVHSALLEELDLGYQCQTKCRSIHIVTPLLKQLKLNVHCETNMDVSILAPMVDNVAWWRMYTPSPPIFGFWQLQSMRFETVESNKHKDEEGVCSHLPRVHVLTIALSSFNPSGVAVDFAHEMEKLLVTNYSGLLGMHQIRTKTQKLVIILPWQCQMPQASNYLGNFSCDEPKDRRSQNISLTFLEEVEINNFRGGEHEIDLVRSIFGWAPMLRRMIIRLACEIKQGEIGGCVRTIDNMCLANPSLNCFVYLSSAVKWSCPSGLL